MRIWEVSAELATGNSSTTRDADGDEDEEGCNRETEREVTLIDLSVELLVLFEMLLVSPSVSSVTFAVVAVP